MKTRSLYLLRHGKSDWDANYEHDHERPLNGRGERAARRAGRALALLDQRPDRLLTSTAVRAATTARLAAAAGEFEARPDERGELYGASAREVLSLIQPTTSSEARVLVCGHEPTLSELVSLLTHGGNVRFPTACLARIDLVCDWQELEPGRGQLQWLLPARLLHALLGD